jgi:succinate dehydrogenase hydrophobic anchor subunit
MENTIERHAPQARPRAGLGSLSWLVQAVSGILLLFLGGLHMFANHFVVEGGLRNFEDAQAYLRHPVILPLEILFLITVTVHALLGVRAILFDLGLSDQAERRVTQALAAVGVLTIGYGLWLTWVVIRL